MTKADNNATGRPEPFLAAHTSVFLAEDVRAAVDSIVAAAPKKDFGLVMKDAMKELKGKADMALVSRLVKEKTAA